jgi:hypothetical protein
MRVEYHELIHKIDAVSTIFHSIKHLGLYLIYMHSEIEVLKLFIVY